MALRAKCQIVATKSSMFATYLAPNRQHSANHQILHFFSGKLGRAIFSILALNFGF